eukprot:8504745-Alexandrium_andersonii.AAC.1
MAGPSASRSRATDATRSLRLIPRPPAGRAGTLQKGSRKQLRRRARGRRTRRNALRSRTLLSL